MNDETAEPTEMLTDTSEATPLATKRKNVKRKNQDEANTSTEKRSTLNDLVFYDGNRNPAGMLHELRPEIRSNSYQFNTQAASANQTRFYCSLTIEKDSLEPITITGVGRSKQAAKNMAAQQALMKLYPTYRPPSDAILTEERDYLQLNRFVPSLAPSINNDPSILIDAIRKHLTIKSLAIKSPFQLFHELFIHNPRLNSSTMPKNQVQLIENEENLFVVRVTAMDQHFWSVSAAKHVALNEACQQAIEKICQVSFREAKAQFIRALQEMNKLKIPNETSSADTNNNDVIEHSHSSEEPATMAVTTTELTSLPGVSSNFLDPVDES